MDSYWGYDSFIVFLKELIDEISFNSLGTIFQILGLNKLYFRPHYKNFRSS